MNSNHILAWFKREGISYPWGQNIDPYRVWISEIMLQQTVVTTVIPYFKRWMERFPTLEALAHGGEGDVLRLWEGLGYYSRARHIHKTARLIYRADGSFPSTYKELVALPGIGDYTACAILSISFKQVLPVIDANVRRICQRLDALPEWDRLSEEKWRSVIALHMDKKEPGLFNCALMQLGQLVCRRNRPSCTICPLNSGCRAYRDNLTSEIPSKTKKKIIKKDSCVLIFKHRDATRTLYWVIQREKGVGQGLWAFPRLSHEQDIPRQWVVKQRLKSRCHLYTKYRETLNPRVLEEKNRSPGGSTIPCIPAIEEGEGFWATAGELHHLAVPAVYRKIINELITLPE